MIFSRNNRFLQSIWSAHKWDMVYFLSFTKCKKKHESFIHFHCDMVERSKKIRSLFQNHYYMKFENYIISQKSKNLREI